VLFYLIVLYGCVCQPLINGYDDDDVCTYKVTPAFFSMSVGLYV